MSDIRSRFSMSSGSKYLEIRLLDGTSGVDEGTVGLRTTLPSVGDLGYTSGLCWDSLTGDVYLNGALVASTGVSGVINPLINIALKFGVSNVEVWMGHNNSYFNSGNPSAGTSPLTTIPLGTWYAAAGSHSLGAPTGRIAQLLALEDSQFYSPPTGFVAAVADTIVWEPVP